MSQNPTFLDDIVQELHVESRHWLSVIELWKFEINFFQLLVEKANPKDAETSNQLQHFLSQIKTYAELLPQMETELRKHEGVLKDFAAGSTSLESLSYRENHMTTRKRIKTLFQEVKDLKSELYSFMEQFL